MDYSPLLVLLMLGMCLLVDCKSGSSKSGSEPDSGIKSGSSKSVSKSDDHIKSSSTSDSRSKSSKCDDEDLPLIAGAEYEIHGNTAHYECVSPATAVTQADCSTSSDSSTSSAAVAVYDCSKKKWRNTYNKEPLECSGLKNCNYGSATYVSGQIFKSTDGCNTCGCSNGAVMCTEMYCRPAVDGGWSDWSKWGDCTATCGSGTTTTRTRTCNSPVPLNDGAGCDGPAMETVDCYIPACPVDGGWSDWSKWGDCTATCGSGTTTTRTRTCNSPVPLNDGAGCDGPAMETVDCYIPACPVSVVDGVWGEWMEWGDCTQCSPATITSQTRTRVCDNPAPGLGGADCRGSPTDILYGGCIIPPGRAPCTGP